MAKTARRKLELAIKAGLYDALSKLAKRNGQTRSFLLEASIFRPQIGYYNSLAEEAAALMESLRTIMLLSTETSGSALR